MFSPSLSQNDLPKLCLALGIKPWHLMRTVKTTEGGKVTKEAFLAYWFDPKRPTHTPKSAKKPKKKASKAEIQKAFKDFYAAMEKLQATILTAF